MVRAFEGGRYAFSDFLGMAETDEALRELKSFPRVPYEFFGGRENAERVMLRIGSVQELGYSQGYPIKIIEIKPKNAKFADSLTHRDFLGALMNLGIERSTLGDIVINDSVGYVFCTEKIAPFILENLDRIKHTSVSCAVCDGIPQVCEPKPTEKVTQVTSLRVDLVVAKVYNLSRSVCKDMFASQKIFVNGRICESPGYALKENDLVSVRGFGRFTYTATCGMSKKGKLNIKVLVE